MLKLSLNTLLEQIIYLLIVDASIMRPFNVVARDGIEPPTQAFSGLWLLEPVYFAPAKSNFLISER